MAWFGSARGSRATARSTRISWRSISTQRSRPSRWTRRGWRNLVIEGDNWDALRALRLAYSARVRCILIDPPYNSGSRDFAYNDRYVGTQDRYRQSLWLEFLYRRLLLARDLLAEDGVILVCINDENRARLDLLMEQVFPGMRLGSFVWRTKDTNNSDKRRNWSGVHEHVLVYANSGFGFIGPDAGPGKFRLRPEFGNTEVRLIRSRNLRPI